MGFSKKTGKGRLDKYYFLAKDQGYRARSAFKLVQLHKKYNLLDQARVVIDLCAAPGGWLQVAAKYMPVSHVIVGVDLVPIKPIPGVKTIVADITTDKCRSELKKELKSWKADLVLHDGAPNLGKSWLHDAYSQAELVLHSLKLATEFLAPDGAFVTKVFRSKDYNSLLWVFNQLFNKVEATKPASSRSVSAEIFVVCRGFKAPTQIDPRFLDPKYVFEDIALLQAQSSGRIDLLHPEKKVRHRGGYEDGATVLFKSLPVTEFVKSNEPNTILASHNQLIFTPDTPSEITKSLEENAELVDLCADLKVLGRREFKILSKWRKEMRATLGLDVKVEEGAGKEGADNIVVDEDPLEEAEEHSKRRGRLEKRDKRKALERKAKQRLRLQLSLGNADDLADEFAANEPLFSLVSNRHSTLADNADMFVPSDKDEIDTEGEKSEESGINDSDISTLDEDSSEVMWESELEDDYVERLEKMDSKDAVGVAKSIQRKKRKTSDSSDASQEEFSHPDVLSSSSNESSDSQDDEISKKSTAPPLITSLLSKDEEKAEKDAKIAMWYSNPLFSELTAGKDSDAILESSSKKLRAEKKRKLDSAKEPREGKKGKKDSKKPSPSEIIFVKADPSDHEQDEDEEGEKRIDPKLKTSVLTPSGMTLAAKFAEDKKRAKKDLVDASFNRYTFKDVSSLPRWFTDDESKHNRPQKPITKEGIALLKSKLKELQSRPIKKELEAKGRNRQRMVKKLDALKKKAAVIADSEDMGERQKSEQIQKLMKKAGKPKRRETKLVVSRGATRGVKGRPKGVKGHYKMVDGRMKKEVRAQKRIKKNNKGKKGSRR